MSVVESDLPIWGLPCPMDSPVWDASPGFLPDSAIGFAQAVEAGRADLCPRGRPLPMGQTFVHGADLVPAPDLLLCLLTDSCVPGFTPNISVCGSSCVPGPSPYTLTLE